MKTTLDADEKAKCQGKLRAEQDRVFMHQRPRRVRATQIKEENSQPSHHNFGEKVW